MASSSSSTTDIASLKTKLKTWERQFKSTEGREPTKLDIKSNPEIAKMYSTYNSLGRAGARKSEGLPKPSSSISTVDSLDKHSTPTKQQRGERSRKRVGTAPEAKKPSPTSYAHANSPSKLRKLAQDHSPRKNSHSKKLGGDRATKTPKSNPFDSESGGGKGSPGLFADLLLEAKNTPRTKARRFLIGTGSPLKPKPHIQALEPTILAGGGLSSFLKSQTEPSPDDIQPEENENEDEDEEVLGPSPFKPKPNVAFRPLFDDAEAESELKLSPTNKPKQPKWKISSRTPFISNSQSQSPASNFSNHPESAQRDPIKSDKKKPLALGNKRKRILLGEEEKSFYEDLPESNASKTRTITRGINKKKKIEPPKPKPVTNRKANLAVSASSSRQPPQTASGSDDSEPEQRPQLPDLPFGDPEQPGVYTELDTFLFTAQLPAESDVAPASRFSSKQSKTINKGKGKEKETGDNVLATAAGSSMPVKLGTRKVLVRPYRPVEADGMGKNPNGESFIDRPPDIDLDGSPNLDADTDEGDSGNAENSNDDTLSDEDKLLAEGDIQISEDLMNVLSIKDGLSGQDRRTLARDKAREERVRRILDGKSIMERTLSTSEPFKPSSKINQNKSKSKVPAFNRPVAKQSSGADDDLKFELALEDRENEEEEEEEAADEDDDWEENPEGWKEVDDGMYLDDDFIR